MSKKSSYHYCCIECGRWLSNYSSVNHSEHCDAISNPRISSLTEHSSIICEVVKENENELKDSYYVYKEYCGLNLNPMRYSPVAEKLVGKIQSSICERIRMNVMKRKQVDRLESLKNCINNLNCIFEREKKKIEKVDEERVKDIADVVDKVFHEDVAEDKVYEECMSIFEEIYKNRNLDEELFLKRMNGVRKNNKILKLIYALLCNELGMSKTMIDTISNFIRSMLKLYGIKEEFVGSYTTVQRCIKYFDNIMTNKKLELLENCESCSISHDSTPLHQQEYYGFNIRLINNNIMYTFPLCPEINGHTDSGSIANLLQHLLEKNGALEKCVSITSDGCRKLIGSRNGANTLLTDKIKRAKEGTSDSLNKYFNQQVWCFDHRFALACIFYMKNETLRCVFEFLIWMGESQNLAKFYTFIGDKYENDPKKKYRMDVYCVTRWLYIGRILNKIVEHLEDVNDFIRERKYSKRLEGKKLFGKEVGESLKETLKNAYEKLIEQLNSRFFTPAMGVNISSNFESERESDARKQSKHVDEILRIFYFPEDVKQNQMLNINSYKLTFVSDFLSTNIESELNSLFVYLQQNHDVLQMNIEYKEEIMKEYKCIRKLTLKDIFMKCNEFKSSYPYLYELFTILEVIQPTTVQVESMFSILKRIVIPQKSENNVTQQFGTRRSSFMKEESITPMIID